MNQTLKLTNLIKYLNLNRRFILNQNLLINNYVNNQFNNQQKRSITRGRVNVLREMKARSKDFYIEPHKKRHRREWLDWNYDCEIYSFNQRLNEKFNDHTLKKAFIFESFTKQTNKQLNPNDDELEILNQIELDNNNELIQSGYEFASKFINLYLRYFLKDVPEQCISSVQNFLLSEDSLSEMAKSIGCEELILCDELPVSKTTLSKTMLSLIGALYLDTDEKHTRKFIIDFVLTYLYSIDIMDIWNVGHNMLKDILNLNGINDFEYRLLRETGANTIIPSYLVGVYCNKKLLGFGPGSSIEEAKEMATIDSLRRIFNLNIANQVYEFGEKAYDLDYDKFDKPNLSISNYKINLDRFKSLE